MTGDSPTVFRYVDWLLAITDYRILLIFGDCCGKCITILALAGCISGDVDHRLYFS